MIRFTSTDNGTTTIVSVAGRLEASQLAKLESLRASARHQVVFDLSQLQNADDASIRWLCDRVQQGCRVAGASPYIDLRLERAKDRS